MHTNQALYQSSYILRPPFNIIIILILLLCINYLETFIESVVGL